MANFHAIHGVSRALLGYLRGGFPADLVDGPCEFRVLSSGEQDGTADFETSVSLWLYRITTNEHARGMIHTASPSGHSAPLALDLHYLLTVWSSDAHTEQTVLAWAMARLHRAPQLDLSMLSDDLLLPGDTHPAGWTLEDVLTVVQEAMSTEDLMRIWDASAYSYRLSVPYVVRVVRLDAEEAITPPHVISSRHIVGATGG